MRVATLGIWFSVNRVRALNPLAPFVLMSLPLFLFAQNDPHPSKDPDSLNWEAGIPSFNSGSGESDQVLEEQDVSPLLQSGRDVFLQFAVFQFAAGRYRLRGYPAENQSLLFNGMNASNLETGYSLWNQWGGLNDITRKAENQYGNVCSRYGFSPPGGYVNIDARASGFRQGTRISYSYGNRLFRQRLMLTHSTGMMDNGWALTVSASWRYGDQVYIPGTYYNSKAFFLSLDKKLSERHLLNLTALSVNTEQGRSGVAQAEVYRISGNPYYNSYWGLQNGVVRNASVSRLNKPILLLNHRVLLPKQSTLNNMLFYTFGKSGLSGLNWNDAPNPRPDYYRYLPSYAYSLGDSGSGEALTALWATDVNTSQINWDRMIGMNRQNLFALPGEGPVNNQTRARYILENRVEQLSHLGFSSVYNSRWHDVFISAGLNANLYRNRKYKEMEDLLGATYWLDYDQFADDQGVNNDFQQNDIEHPDKKIYRGDRFGYDYQIAVNRIECWLQSEYSMPHIDLYVGGSLSHALFWREGYVANGKFPQTSKGLSEKSGFLNYGLKTGMTWKISGRHFFNLHLLSQSRAPEVNSMFISQRTRNDLVEGLQNEQVMSVECNYQIKYPGLKGRISAYYTSVRNQTWLRSFWHDEYNNMVNLITKNLDQRYSGIELGVEKQIFTEHLIQGAMAYALNLYSNRPTLEAWQDNNNSKLYANRSAYLINYYMGGSPQSVYGLGYRYNARKHWYVGVYANFFDRIFVEINPERRTAEAIDKYQSNEAQYYSAILQQEELPSYMILNANAGKSFRIRKKHYLNLSAVLYNLLNNTSHISSGFEQLRWDKSDLKRFDNKYTYMQGTTFLINASFTIN